MIPLADQIAEVEREIRQRERLYPKWIAAGKLKQVTADKKLAELHAAVASLKWLDANQSWIKIQAERMRQAEAQRRMDEAMGHPGIAAVMQEFPDTEVIDVRALEPAEAGKEKAA